MSELRIVKQAHALNTFQRSCHRVGLVVRRSRSHTGGRLSCGGGLPIYYPMPCSARPHTSRRRAARERTAGKHARTRPAAAPQPPVPVSASVHHVWKSVRELIDVATAAALLARVADIACAAVTIARANVTDTRSAPTVKLCIWVG